MTTFIGIRGTAIQAVSSDPANPETGQIWYNSSSGTLKGYVFATINAWSAGANLNYTRSGAGSGGTQTAAVVFAGNSPSTSPDRNKPTETYNGTSWTNGPTMNTGRTGVAQAGTQTAALCAGGDTGPPSGTAASESWNGSAWTNTPSLNTSRYGIRGTGVSNTAALAAGGVIISTYQSASESYNGTSWTNTPSLNTARGSGAMAGSNTSALYFGGSSGPRYANTEYYNGTSWTTVNSLNTARESLGGSGSQTAALAFGGNIGGAPAVTSATELYNGTTWTSNPTGLATARDGVDGLNGSAPQSATMAMGGSDGTNQLASTEKWNTTAFRTRTITVS